MLHEHVRFVLVCVGIRLLPSHATDNRMLSHKLAVRHDVLACFCDAKSLKKTHVWREESAAYHQRVTKMLWLGG